MNLRLSAVVGAILGVLGLAALAYPRLAAALPADDAAVVLVGAVLVLGGLREVYRRHEAVQTYAETPDTEEAIELPAPGDDLDRQLARLSALMYRANERQRIRNQVTEVAVETLRRTGDYTENEARRALEAGTWTDDPYAAAFFTGRAPDTDRVSRVRELIRTGTAFQHRTRCAVDELYRLAEGGDADDRR